ncbi:DUF2865 domain-containing protein [Roseibium sp.]|uniref:DUF2865 domain-containing protein n=1 Tax=Roseibium sp. TaxID=1936156 RepID=UPI003D0BC600
MRLCRNARSVRFAQALAAAAALVLSANLSHAASCASLKTELQRLESAGGSQSPAAQKWAKAQKQQQKSISAAERDANYFGCTGANTAKCQSLNTKLKRMKANLAAIERQLAKSGGGSSRNKKRLQQVKASLARQNCDAPAQTRQAAGGQTGDSQPQSLFSRLFGARSRQDVEPVSARTGDREIAAVRSRTANGAPTVYLPSGGTFRTLCVRTCDGYFFPLSFKTGKNSFAYDASRCSEICPAAETELYVYRNPGGDPSQMISLAGALYSEQPFAFRYKSEYVEGCGCRETRQSKMRSSWRELTKGSSDRVFFSDISAGLPRRTLRPSLGGTFEESGETPSPMTRPPLSPAQLPPHEDPDTRFNLQMGFNVAAPLAEVVKRLKKENPVQNDLLSAKDGLPLLSLRSTEGAAAESSAAASPVFRKEDDGFRPAPDQKAPVRVVGPEYFVAQ